MTNPTIAILSYVLPFSDCSIHMYEPEKYQLVVFVSPHNFTIRNMWTKDGLIPICDRQRQWPKPFTRGIKIEHRTYLTNDFSAIFVDVIDKWNTVLAWSWALMFEVQFYLPTW